MEIVKAKEHFLKAKSILLTVASLAGAVVVIAGAYSFYQNNFYNPKKDLKVLSVDYDKGMAEIQFGKDRINIIGDATFSLKANWGVKFGQTNGQYENISIIQSGMVFDYLDQKKA